MRLNTSPVEVVIKREVSQPLDRGAFYNMCFITEHDYAPRTLEVNRLQDLLDNGYSRFTLAYIFCLTAFRQKQMPKVFIRAKRTNESYVDAYDADSNLNYYFISIQSKFLSDILSVNDRITDLGDSKLQFFSHKDNLTNQIKGRKLVYFYYPFEVGDFGNILFDGRENVLWDDFGKIKKFVTPESTVKEYFLNIVYGKDTMPHLSDGLVGWWKYDQDDYAEWDDYKKILLQKHDLTQDQVNIAISPYPEASWIAYCGNFFPSQIQWLYKSLPAISDIKPINIPDLSTVYSKNIGVKATFGSGKTLQGVPIKEQVSIDWLQWAIEQNLWNLLYTSENINATESGLTIVENVLREVLDASVEYEIFQSYKITSRSLNRVTNKASFKFSANLEHSILNAEVEGVVYN